MSVRAECQTVRMHSVAISLAIGGYIGTLYDEYRTIFLFFLPGVLSLSRYSRYSRDSNLFPLPH